MEDSHRIVVRVNAEELTHKGILLLVHAGVENTEEWVVSSKETGLCIARGGCRNSVIKKARRRLNSVPPKVLAQIIQERALPPDRRLTRKHVSILTHALGLDKNHFCTSPGCDLYRFCEQLVNWGFMKKHKSPDSSDICYTVTEKGKAILVQR